MLSPSDVLSVIRYYDPIVLDDTFDFDAKAAISFIFKYVGDASLFKETKDWGLLDKGKLQILFLRKRRDPKYMFSGHVCFAGGMREPGETGLENAVRETLEELELDLDKDGYYLGRLDDTMTVSGVLTSVYAFLLVDEVDLVLNEGELDGYCWVDLDYFDNPISRDVMWMKYDDKGHASIRDGVRKCC
eukprot:TRINITY_DN2362_c0_g1_i1.p1 TRINITY_DN2362_c0_g1~~TRINITY_DN2362_c0_g1_i1.p1  ORF type:complete len:188 (+),score=40.91 TRINITY_DN2362_c0_g1_i1:2-565(+)